MTAERILILDAGDESREQLAGWLRAARLCVSTARSPAEALDERGWDVLLMDARSYVEAEQGELIARLRDSSTAPAMLVLVDCASLPEIEGMAAGSGCDVVLRPANAVQAQLRIRNTLALRAARTDLARARTALEVERPGLDLLIGAGLDQVRHAVSVVAPTDATVLITGEPGTGRNHVARTIHASSQRRFAPFVTIECATVSDEAFTSELFGHDKTSANGTAAAGRGLVELADGGTLLLTGIAHSSPHVQREVTRVLEERRIVRAGSHQLVPVNFRCLASSTPDLHWLMQQHRFSPDLFYWLDVIEIAIPPLRRRAADIPAIARHFADRCAATMGRSAPRFSPAALSRLQRHPWPGNVRELANTVERAVLTMTGSVIDSQDIALAPRKHQADVATTAQAAPL